MKKNKLIIAIILIAVGIFALNYDRISYNEGEEEVGWGPFTHYEEEENTISVSKVLGIIAIVVGGYFLYTKIRKK